MPLLPFSDWRAEQLRLTAFPMPGATTRSPGWWESTVASLPDEITSNPDKGSTTVAGSFGSGKLILKLEPDRIAWLFALQDPDPESHPEPLQADFPSLGPVIETLNAFSNIAERWFDQNDIPDIARIAFSAVLKHDEPDRQSGYVRLPHYVLVQADPVSSDFFYQTNLPVTSQSGIDGLLINRLSKWSVMGQISFAVRFTGVTATPEAPRPFTHVLRLELDVNTAAQFHGPIPRGRLIELYHELIAHGQQIATEGLD